MKASVTEWNPPERIFFEKSGRKERYSNEFIPVIETENLSELGRLTALTFIHWIKENPDGVVALPAGKTGFIKYFRHYKENWKVQKDVWHLGDFPSTEGLRFVQVEEFYPFDFGNKNSFTHFIKTQYLPLLEISEKNFLGMERCKDHQEVQEFCVRYEQTIREWGGIGFFLGEIGSDGRIAFNMPGSLHDSQTRVVRLNYASAADVAGSLGGIEYARDKTAITIGLGTITFNPKARVIIIAAGEDKALVVAQSIESKPSKTYPATALQCLKGTRFYLTKGAASQLEARRVEDIEKKSNLTSKEIDDVIIELALKVKRPLMKLTDDDFLSNPRSVALRKKIPGELSKLLENVRMRLIAKIDRGLNLPQSKTILHTSPHHDDIMLSYHSLMRKLVSCNENHFIYLTSGFNAVTNDHMQKALAEVGETLKKTISNVFQINTPADLDKKIVWLREEYFPHRQQGEKDIREVQILKGALRESEAEHMLLAAGVKHSNISHLRAKFYIGGAIEEDIQEILSFYRKLRPDIITVAFDPEGTGPDTHYKVLQVVTEALRQWEGAQVSVWGYRNVWYRFTAADATLLSPVSEKEMDQMHHAFLTCFSTQREASFPSPRYDGPFSGLAMKIQRAQYEELKLLLGEEFFTTHPHPSMKTARGFLFIKEMARNYFLQQSKNLKMCFLE